MKTFIERHPFWFSLLFTVLIMQMLGFVVVVVGARILGLNELPVRIAAAAVTTIVPLFVIWRIGWWEDAGLGSSAQNLYALLVPLTLTFFPLLLMGTTTMAPQRVGLFLLAVVFTGISEEAVYRGLYIRAFLPYGKWRAVFLPAVFFASAHIVQSLGGGMSFGENIVQIANAFFYGVMLGAVRLRINNIWPLIILHTLIDLFWVTSGLSDGVYTMSDIPLSVYLIEWLPSVIAAAYLLSKPIVATIDGKQVRAISTPVAASAID